jgi:DNA-binding HxlR family transcriptional regulator
MASRVSDADILRAIGTGEPQRTASVHRELTGLLGLATPDAITMPALRRRLERLAIEGRVKRARTILPHPMWQVVEGEA